MIHKRRTCTASARRLTPLSIAALPSTPNLMSLLMERVAPMEEVVAANLLAAELAAVAIVLLDDGNIVFYSFFDKLFEYYL